MARRKPLSYYRDKQGRIRPIFAPRGRTPTVIVVDRKATKSIRRQPFTKEAVEGLEDRSGFYTVYDHHGKLLYVGAANSVRSRLVDFWYGRGDHRTVEGKGMLRPQAAKFDVTYMPIEQARLNEKRIKQVAQFNVR